MADLRVIARAFEGIVVKISSKQLAEEEVWLQLLYRSLENMGKIVMIAADEAEANEIAYMLEMADFNTPSSLEWEGCWIVIAKKMQTFSGRSL